MHVFKESGRFKWTIRLPIHDGRIVKFPGDRSKQCAQELGMKIEMLVQAKQRGEFPPACLAAWIANTPLAKRLKKVGLLETSKFADPNIEEMKERHLEASLRRTTLVGGHRLKPSSYTTMKRQLRRALKPHSSDRSGKFPIPLGLKLSELQLCHLRDFHDYWHSAALKISRRTRKNLCLALWKLLNDAANDDAFNFTIPKGASRLFRFAGDTANIAAYDPGQLKSIKSSCSERTWLYCLLAMNGGMYQVDIGHLQVGTTVVQLDSSPYGDKDQMGEVVRLVNGKPVALSREELRSYVGSHNLYIRRIRNRTAHKYPYAALHWLFPETVVLLKKCLAPANPWDFALLGKFGQPLYRHSVDKPIQSPISNAFRDARDKIRKAGGTTISFKQFRKLGVSAMGKFGDDTAVRLYRSQRPVGDASMYLLDDYEAKLTPYLQAWHAQLKADGVL